MLDVVNCKVEEIPTGGAPQYRSSSITDQGHISSFLLTIFITTPLASSDKSGQAGRCSRSPSEFDGNICTPLRPAMPSPLRLTSGKGDVQDDAIAAMVEVMRAARRKNPRTLFVVGSYHIGKERAYLGAAAELGWKVWCPAAKRRVSCWIIHLSPGTSPHILILYFIMVGEATQSAAAELGWKVWCPAAKRRVSCAYLTWGQKSQFQDV